MANSKSGKKVKTSKNQTKNQTKSQTKTKTSKTVTNKTRTKKATAKAKPTSKVATKTNTKAKPKTTSKVATKAKSIKTGKSKASQTKLKKGANYKATPTAVLPAAAQKKFDPEALSSLEGLFTPLDNRVLAVVDLEEQKTTGGLYIPEVAQTKPFTGIVIAHGPGHRSKKGKLRPVAVQKGDRILFDKYGGQKIMLENHDVVILREDEIIGVLTD